MEQSARRGMVASGRRFRFALISLTTAVVAGLVAAWPLWPPPMVEVRYVERAFPLRLPESRDAPRGLPGPHPAQGPVEGNPSGGASPPFSRAVGSDSLSWLDVAVVEENGEPCRTTGVVYALPAGEPGADDLDDVSHATLGNGASARLAVPIAGAYDVGCRALGRFGLATNVCAEAGKRTPVTVRLPAGLPLEVVWDRSQRDADAKEGPDLQGKLLLAALDVPFREFPGRGEHLGLTREIDLWSDGPWVTTDLPRGTRLEVGASLIEFAPRRGGEKAMPGPCRHYRLVADRTIAFPGDTVRVRLEHLARVTIRLRGIPSTDWPEGGASGTFYFEQGWGTTPHRAAWGSRAEIVGRTTALDFEGVPGQLRLRWEGEGIAEGSREDLFLESGENGEVECLLRPDLATAPPSRASANREHLSVWIQGLSARGSAPGLQEEPRVFAVAATEDGTASETLDSAVSLEGPEPFPVSDDFHRSREILAVFGTTHASDPVPVPAGGSVVVTVRPAGLLIVVPETVTTAGMGKLEVRRSDGLPIPVRSADDWTMLGEARLSPRVQPGTMLGPFPEGELRFEVRLGRVRLPDATATVRAGHIGVLRIRTRTE